MGNNCLTDNATNSDIDLPPVITVLVRYAQGLPGVNWSLENDRLLYFGVGVEDGGDELHKSYPKLNVLDPVWNEEFLLPANLPLIFTVFEEIADGNAVAIACATLDMASASAVSFSGALPLEPDGVIVLKAKSGDDYPATQGSEFAVTIENQKKQALGLELDSMDPEKLFVVSVKKNTVMDAYNNSCDDNKVEAGCFIVGAVGLDGGGAGCDVRFDVGSRGFLGMGNGNSSEVTPSRAMETVLKSNPKQVHLLCRQAHKFRIRVTCPSNERLGISLPERPQGNSLIITKVKDGPVATWNANNPDQTFEAWDRIVAVDGKSGNAADLLKLVKAAPNSYRCVLTILRMASACE